MSVTLHSQGDPSELRRTRMIAAAIGFVVVIDVIWVRAPFLLLLGVPFMVAAWRYRGRHAATTVLLALFSLAYVAVGVTYAASNGFYGPSEPGAARTLINPGDFAVVYIGTPLAMWLCARLVRGAVRRTGRQGAVAS